jgi:hypothetical protein
VYVNVGVNVVVPEDEFSVSPVGVGMSHSYTTPAIAPLAVPVRLRVIVGSVIASGIPVLGGTFVVALGLYRLKSSTHPKKVEVEELTAGEGEDAFTAAPHGVLLIPLYVTKIVPAGIW